MDKIVHLYYMILWGDSLFINFYYQFLLPFYHISFFNKKYIKILNFNFFTKIFKFLISIASGMYDFHNNIFGSFIMKMEIIIRY